MLGVSRQRVDQLARTEGFPKPTVLATARIWDRAEVEAWARKAGRMVRPIHGRSPGSH